MQALQEYHALTNGIFNQHRGTMRLGRSKNAYIGPDTSLFDLGLEEFLFGTVWTLGCEVALSSFKRVGLWLAICAAVNDEECFDRLGFLTSKGSEKSHGKPSKTGRKHHKAVESSQAPPITYTNLPTK